MQLRRDSGQWIVHEARARCRPRIGVATVIMFPAQKIPTVGAPTAAARCSGPVSLATTTAHSAYSAASPPSETAPTSGRIGRAPPPTTRSTNGRPPRCR